MNVRESKIRTVTDLLISEGTMSDHMTPPPREIQLSLFNMLIELENINLLSLDQDVDTLFRSFTRMYMLEFANDLHSIVEMQPLFMGLPKAMIDLTKAGSLYMEAPNGE